ncbi:TPA: class IV adenylate cyclase [Candidatus Ventrenecus stercoripullorum]|nr:class IV adenylate cyclase [Candidatus Ventrenecus stercoripullorum]
MESEIRILEIDKEKFIEQIEKLGATKKGEYFYKRCVYDFHPAKVGKWIRLRTSGEETTLTIKEIIDNKKIDGTRELEIVVSDFEKTKEILEELGYIPRDTQENKRTRYMYQDVEIDIDTWPHIPTYVEIEGKDEDAVKEFLKCISYQEEKLTTLDVDSIYREIYHIDPDKTPLVFEDAK